MWPQHFKESVSVIMLKPRKELYDSPKCFRFITLLPMVGKLLEKILTWHIQQDCQCHQLLHAYQFSSIAAHSTKDVSTILIHWIKRSWTTKIYNKKLKCFKQYMISVLVFDLTQFF